MTEWVVWKSVQSLEEVTKIPKAIRDGEMYK